MRRHPRRPRPSGPVGPTRPHRARLLCTAECRQPPSVLGKEQGGCRCARTANPGVSLSVSAPHIEHARALMSVLTGTIDLEQAEGPTPGERVGPTRPASRKLAVLISTPSQLPERCLTHEDIRVHRQRHSGALMGAQLMVEVADLAPQGLNAAHWRALMVVARIANDTTRSATLDELLSGGLQRLMSAESAGGAAKRVNTLVSYRLLRQVVPPTRENPSVAYQIPRYNQGDHLAPIDVSSQPTALYRLFDEAGNLLYIGITGNPRVRFDQHALDKPWWPQVARSQVHWHGTRAEAEAIETQLIRRETPPHNKSDIPTPTRQRRQL